eukprot:8449302-Pyramimonas_sp.AAC.1
MLECDFPSGPSCRRSASASSSSSAIPSCSSSSNGQGWRPDLPLGCRPGWLVSSFAVASWNTCSLAGAFFGSQHARKQH